MLEESIRRERISNQLQYFNVPWIIRISLIVYAILWSLGEIFCFPLLRMKGWFLYSLSPQWQHNVCRLYLLSGMMEPDFFLTLIFLVYGSLHQTFQLPSAPISIASFSVILKPEYNLELRFCINSRHGQEGFTWSQTLNPSAFQMI